MREAGPDHTAADHLRVSCFYTNYLLKWAPSVPIVTAKPTLWNDPTEGAFGQLGEELELLNAANLHKSSNEIC